MMLLPILLLSALAGQGFSQDPSPTASADATPCHVRCFSQFMEDVNNSCKNNCVCTGSELLSSVECCMTKCPADQQANVTVSVQNTCSDGKSLKLDYTCAANTTTATTSSGSIPTSLATSIILVSAETVTGSAATATNGAGGMGGGIGSDGGGQGSSIVGLGVGLGVGLPLAAVLVGGLTLLWKRSRTKKKSRGRGLELGSNMGAGAPDAVGRTFVFPSTMVLPSPGLPPDAEAGSSGDHKEGAVEAEVTPYDALGYPRHH
ncbi:hypothetical protein CkaCkLH20_02733 [Colletotrichum karsti]|uniref:Extracellular membrane protein CFEM domain-containing protein n=1 Tax=Colletotrichum karsti TaxID=1095194 RepID=A0A9P6ICM9_9PEZI|nr:uncharacterized protein CkaCkLH20_02733 [Colletotrichum karsti]KAF9879922.1 hypothetical protein CkaCkLH20_02733 [Colletotrichum karsti]